MPEQGAGYSPQVSRGKGAGGLGSWAQEPDDSGRPAPPCAARSCPGRSFPEGQWRRMLQGCLLPGPHRSRRHFMFCISIIAALAGRGKETHGAASGGSHSQSPSGEAAGQARAGASPLSRGGFP